MSDSRGVKAIHEIFADREDRYKAELTAYLDSGWTLVDIHQRSYSDPHTKEDVNVSVYIVGHSDPDVLPPKWGDNSIGQA
ncbi:MAG: hypothetical protein GC179_01725 [Anaerolineaceae bacterium]|nr:hypothetical protein [Anaerolineaceae bacterium]